jgi:hypothetical protein
MVWSEDINVKDDNFHPRNNDPWWNEASYISFRVPERDLMGLLYFYFRPNQNTAMGGPLIWDPTGRSMNTIAHNGWSWHMGIPEGADMFDFKLENGFGCDTIVPQQEHRYSYESPGCEFELTFTASYPPHYLKLDRQKNDVDPGMFDFVRDVEGDITTGHYEHFGRMNGTLILNGETIDVSDGVVFRDHTWGPRKILANMHRLRGGYSLGMADDRNAFNTFATCDIPWEDDPIDGVKDKITAGFQVKDGVPATIVSGTRQRINAPDGWPLGEIIDAVDELGRELHAEGRIVSGLDWPGLWGDLAAYWCYERWDWDGNNAVCGELQDWTYARHFRKWLQDKVPHSVSQA